MLFAELFIAVKGGMMKNFKIADINLHMECFGETLTAQSLSYLAGKDEKADITICSTLVDKIVLGGRKTKIQENTVFTRDEACSHIYIHEDSIIRLHMAADSKNTDVRLEFCGRITEYPHLSLDELEYIQTGFAFSRALLEFNGFCLHASAVAVENRAVLFSGPCGTGKSTHTGLWQQYFSPDRAVIVNDDKPALRLMEDTFYVYGTPWSGKSTLNANMKVPLQAIVFLKQAEGNHIRRLSSKEAVKMLIYQSLRPDSDSIKMDRLLTLLDALLKKIPIYQMDCTISTDAVKLAYDTINSGRM